MWYVNSALNGIFDLLLTPFRSLNPLWPLVVFSLITGIIMLVIFRYTSNQAGIKQAKDRIKGYLYEIRLFKDDLRVLFSAQKNILRYNLTYIRHGLKPMLFMTLPIVLILIQLDGWFGYRPLNPGESAVVSLKLSENGDADALSNVSIESSDGITIETPPLRIPGEREVNWRIRANEPGEQSLTFGVLNDKFQKRLIVADGKLSRLSPVMPSGFWDTFLHPGEKPIAESSPVRQIEINYPPRSIGILGWGVHWLVVFFIVSIAFAFAFKGLFKVEV